MENSGESGAVSFDAVSPAVAETRWAGSPHGSLPDPGWYPDPSAPGRERWWSGERWTEFSHAAARSSLYPADYVRSFWRGANHHARTAYWFYISSAVLVFGSTIALFVIGSRGEPAGGNVGIGILSLFVVALGLAVATVVRALQALRAASRLGALGLSITMLAGSCILALWALGAIAALLLPVWL